MIKMLIVSMFVCLFWLPYGFASEVEVANISGTEKSNDIVWATKLFGICDASAAVMRSDGVLVVASDEHNTISTFNRSSGEKRNDLTPSLEGLLEKAGLDLEIDDDTDLPREIDVEGAAVLSWKDEGEIVIWIGSHSGRKAKWKKKKGKVRKAKERKNRNILFATNLPDDRSELTLVGSPITNLSSVLLAPPKELKTRLDILATSKPPLWPNAGGWNIEGLATDADGRLILGFRSPVDSNKLALVVRIDNPHEAITIKDTKVVLGAAEWLNLGNRGIRSMDWSSTHKYWLIVAGPVGHVDISNSKLPNTSGYAQDFAVFRWDGFGTEPKKLEYNLSDLRPEILVPTKDGFYLISDDGKVKHPGSDGETCADCLKDSSNPDYPYAFARARFFSLKH